MVAAKAQCNRQRPEFETHEQHLRFFYIFQLYCNVKKRMKINKKKRSVLNGLFPH